ncbi:zinc finger BED domain-containing protein 4-like [Rhizophagus irregularis DAOM 181602=DAOM 197198]|nr:zinc finger BED domain-containing protein 4-like [Rhizophagus irregularis DAOM 181602=DAOM 197198]
MSGKLSADVWEFFQKIQDEESWLITNYKCILCAKLYSPDSLVDFVATDLQPFTIVENPEFKLLINKLNPHYILPCRQTLKEKFIENYKMRKNVNLKRFYLGVTMHYINNNWELKNLLLDLIPVNGSHTAGLITSKLLQILEEFSISNNILALTTDNGSNMIACAVKAGMSHVGNEIKKLRQFVVKIKNSPLFLDKLSEICTLKKVKFLKPILDIDIRWNSTYFMINRQILMQGVSELLATTNVEELGDLFPTISEWRYIKELAKVLEPMYEATNLLSSSKNPTQGDIRLVFNGMFKKLDHYQRGNHHTQKAIASAIYPRYKTTLFSHNDITEIISKLQELYLSILKFSTKDYLTIQATSVSSERAFSISGLTISKTRNSPNFGSNSGSKPITVRFCTQTTSFWTENQMDRTYD